MQVILFTEMSTNLGACAGAGVLFVLLATTISGIWAADYMETKGKKRTVNVHEHDIVCNV